MNNLQTTKEFLLIFLAVTLIIFMAEGSLDAFKNSNCIPKEVVYKTLYRAMRISGVLCLFFIFLKWYNQKK